MDKFIRVPLPYLNLDTHLADFHDMHMSKGEMKKLKEILNSVEFGSKMKKRSRATLKTPSMSISLNISS